MQADFTQLYSRLGLKSDCSLHEFKQAYRRQFAKLHPDRFEGDALSPETQLQLREIIAMYGSALSFHRRHGRLPGALPPAITPPATISAPVPGPQRASRTDVAASSDASSTRHKRKAIALLIASFALVLLVSWELAPPTPEDTTPLQVDVDRSAPASAYAADRLALGMDVATVLAIQGEPVRVRGTEWEYGPSWLRFEDGRLIDWYSSPLHRLKTTVARPEPVAATDTPAR